MNGLSLSFVVVYIETCRSYVGSMENSMEISGRCKISLTVSKDVGVFNFTYFWQRIAVLVSRFYYYYDLLVLV